MFPFFIFLDPFSRIIFEVLWLIFTRNILDCNISHVNYSIQCLDRLNHHCLVCTQYMISKLVLINHSINRASQFRITCNNILWLFLLLFRVWCWYCWYILLLHWQGYGRGNSLWCLLLRICSHVKMTWRGMQLWLTEHCLWICIYWNWNMYFYKCHQSWLAG